MCRRPTIESHGESRTPLYWVWKGIVRRCRSKDIKNRRYYLDRGIKVCESWRNSYVSFRDWATNHGYSRGLEIDRIDNSKGYAPENCRFVTHSVNQNNKSGNRRIFAFGETKTVAQWISDRRCAVGKIAFRQRIESGWSAELAILTPLLPRSERRNFRNKF